MLNFELRKESYRFPNYIKPKGFAFCTLIKNSKLKIDSTAKIGHFTL